MLLLDAQGTLRTYPAASDARTPPTRQLQVGTRCFLMGPCWELDLDPMGGELSLGRRVDRYLSQDAVLAMAIDATGESTPLRAWPTSTGFLTRFDVDALAVVPARDEVVVAGTATTWSGGEGSGPVEVVREIRTIPRSAADMAAPVRSITFSDKPFNGGFPEMSLEYDEVNDALVVVVPDSDRLGLVRVYPRTANGTDPVPITASTPYQSWYEGDDRRLWLCD